MRGHLQVVRKGDDVMRTMTVATLDRAFRGLALGVVLLWAALPASAKIGSDSSGAILVFPKVIVDTSGVLFGRPTDTEIQITNTSNSIIAARCYWVNATSHCSNAPTVACTPATAAQRCGTGGRCVEGWTETDFRFRLTKRQPISFNAADGLTTFPLTGGVQGPGGQTNGDSSIPPVPEDPFIGELKCVQVNPDDFRPTIGFNPANNAAGDLAGHATIVSAVSSASNDLDARKYNAITLKSTTVNDQDDTLVLGGAGAEYDGCPNVWILNHFFDGAVIPSHFSGGSAGVTQTATTDITVVPCSEDFLLQENNLGGAVLQFLIFNEFEQRFSSSTRFTCFREVQLSDIDTRPGTADNAFSIFSVAVQGTLSGQTRIRSVMQGDRANGIMVVAERFLNNQGVVNSSAENVHFTGERDRSDFIVLSPNN
ncbi:MAG: hypothetical protein KatS3mg077_2725 [Candidatus Binatia bacterium]|nr:MAG: hypothetical protein KatS3mg077_2725 [Candidatus Binatia bacterium]